MDNLKPKMVELQNVIKKAAELELDVKQGMKNYLLGFCGEQKSPQVMVVRSSSLENIWSPEYFNTVYQINKLVEVIDSRPLEKVYKVFTSIVAKGVSDQFKGLTFNKEVRGILAPYFE